MTARLPSVRTTESSAVNSTSAVVSSCMEIFLTLPTSTPAIRTKSPFSSPVTFVNSARYVLAFSPNRSCPNTAYNANTPSRHTVRNAPSRHRACFQSVAMACSFLYSSLVLGGHGAGAASSGSGTGGSGVGCNCAGAGTTNGSEPGLGPGSRGAPGGGAGGRPGYSGVPSGAYIGAPYAGAPG